ncbi:MAG: acyltransferase [Planctomycetota bacterium]|jgi:maltose O-acetyltransferase
MPGSDANIAARLKARPWLLWYGVRGLLGGYRCKLWHGLIRRKMSAGRMFRVYGKVHFIGPGKVRFGDDVHILGDVLKPVCFLTTEPGATITIGDHTGVNGTTFAAMQRIRVGNSCVIAAHYITDNQNHSLRHDRMTNPEAPLESAPVTIGDNVFIAAQTVVAHGVTIGENTVIGACSLVRKDVPPGVLAASNPLRVIGPVGEPTANKAGSE